MPMPQFIYPFPTDGYLSCLQLWTIRNQAATNIHVQPLCGHMLSLLLGKYLRGKTGLYNRFMFNILDTAKPSFPKWM